jgi:G3E family GTPase
MAPAAPRVCPVVVLTGPPGAGKTALLRRWLREAQTQGQRVGLVGNGSGGLEDWSADIPSEKAAGCLCCFEHEGVDQPVHRLARDPDIERIVVETAGQAEPDSILDQLTDHDVAEVARVSAVVTVVPVPGFASLSAPGAFWDRVVRQVRFANGVVLSRCAEATPAERRAAIMQVRRINPRAEIVRSEDAGAGFAAVTALPACSATVDAAEFPEPAPTALKAVFLAMSRPITRRRLEDFLRSLDRRDVVRVKGHVRIGSGADALHLVQQVCGWLHVEPWPARLGTPPAELVFIGPDVSPAALTTLLRTITTKPQ